MREATWIRVSHQQAVLLRNLLQFTRLSPSGLVDELVELERKLTEQVIEADPRKDVIWAARHRFSSGDPENIQIDDEAPFSETGIGDWVGAWVWVPSDDSGLDPEPRRK